MADRVTRYAVETKTWDPDDKETWEPVAEPWHFTTAADAHERIASLAKHWVRVGDPFPGENFRVQPFQTEAPTP